MALAHFQRAIVNSSGDLVPGTVVTIVNEATGGLAAIKSDRAGDTPKTNPVTVGPDGILDFYAAGGAYRITGVNGDFSFDWRYVGIGTAQEADYDGLSGDIVINGSPTGVRLTFDTSTSNADPGAGKWRANHATFASITALYIDNSDADGEAITAWLDALDDRGTSDHRGVIRFENVDDPKEWAEFNVTGSVVDSAGYRTLTVTPRAQVGWPFANGVVTPATFVPTGNPGEAATIAVGTVTTVSNTTPASVTNIGTANAAVFDFEIPAGPTGLTGNDLAIDHGPVADITARDAYVGISVGETIGVTDSDGNGTSAIYRLLDDSPQTWSTPLYTSGGGAVAGVSLKSTKLAFLAAI